MISALNHVNLRAGAGLLADLRDFYRDVLGLTVGPRPAFSTPGYWLYAGGHAVLHLSEQTGPDVPRGPVRPEAPTTFDHMAFSGSDPEGTAAHLRSRGVAFRESRSAVTGQHQFFLHDPAGNGVEINFPHSANEG